ncbi:MAG: SusD/RagB family nutrient-binding outer membrane lipoprotein [Bacteroidota bacterium]
MKKIFSIIAIFFTISIAGCKDDFLSLETNPNTPSTATPQFQLSGSQVVSANLYEAAAVTAGGGISATTQGYFATAGVWMGYWTSSGNYVPSSVLNTNAFTNSSYQIFTPFYLNLSNYNDLEKKSAADPTLVHFQAIAKIMKALEFQTLVDTYNNVPYTEAFQAPEILTPKYDKGEVIYDDLMKQLDAAMTAIKGAPATAVNPGTADIIFKGDMTKWVKFANTIKLRLAIRQWNKLASKQGALKTAVTATLANGYIDQTFQAAANPGYSNDDANGFKQSPFHVSYAFTAAGAASLPGDYYKANEYAINKLKTTNDPRLARLYAPVPADGVTFFGNIYGSSAPKNNAGTSGIGPGLLKGATMDAVLLSSSESLFLQSEAAFYGILPGSAQTLYEQGITASFTTLGVTNAAAAATTYYSQPITNVSWNSSTDKVQAIINQKWTALNGYGNGEAYNEYRRTGFPNNVPVSTQSSQPTIPSRIFYPVSESQQNGANLALEGTINQFTSKIFWAK